MKLLERVKRFVRYCINCVVSAAAVVGVYYVVIDYYELDQPTAQHVVVSEAQAEAPKPQTLDDMVQEVAENYDLPPLLLRAVVKHESNDVADAVREEKHHYKSEMVDKAVKGYPAYMQDEMRKMYSRSYGLGQVMGWHAPRFGLKWSDLLVPKTNLIVTAEVLSECRDRAKRDKHNNKQQVTRQMLGCFNGDLKAYPDKIYAALGEIVADKM